jgi:hypothetical protein
MNRTPWIDLSSALSGKPPSGFAASHSRHGFGQPASPARPRPAERAPGTTTLALQLAFDSFREPVPAGHRGGHSSDRHLVYMSRDYAIDLQLQLQEYEPDVVQGELLSRHDGPVAEVPTFLLAGDQIAGYDRTGPLGEFRLETDGSVDLRLCLLLDAERCIDLPLATGPDARMIES